MAKPRILHVAPANTSGVPGQFVQTERKLGYESRLVTLFSDPRNYFQDICLNLPFIDMPLVRRVKRLVSNPQKLKITNVAAVPEKIPIEWRPHSVFEKWLVQWRDALWRRKIESIINIEKLDRFDIYQLDGGLGLYRSAGFILKMKDLGKKIICCYTGSDLRTRGIIPIIDSVSELNVTVEFDHLLLHPDIQHVFFPFDANRFSLHQHHENNRPVLIGHAPTNRTAKGSDIIIPILRRLESEMNVKVILIEGMSYDQAIAAKASCDIFVDQIGDLGYGINALEALAMGIPACSCLAPGFAGMYPDHPFVAVDAGNLKAQLANLVTDAGRRREIGERGRAWVLQNHDAVGVVQKIHNLAGIQ